MVRSKEISEKVRDVSSLKEEKAEFEAVCNSGLFDRTPNLARILNYIGEKYFSGAGSEIKEYSIAVEALRRPASFDPQHDATVRVSMHSIRKRLEVYYAGASTSHFLKLSFPVGRYVPTFSRVEKASEPASLLATILSPMLARIILLIAVVAAFALVAAVAMSLARKRVASRHNAAFSFLKSDGRHTPPRPTSSVQILAGASAGFTSSSGDLWLPDKAFVQGGHAFNSGSARILETSEPQLFRHGRAGSSRFLIPVLPGRYELHLYFAETQGFVGSERQVTYSLNGEQQPWVDVYDDAGGADVAMVKITPNVRPEADGAIHIEFESVDSFVNAIAIVPDPGSAPLPLRIVTGHAPVTDRTGAHWEPDNWYFGGTDVERVPPIRGAGPLYRWERYGNFRYNLPVVSGIPYTVRLFFSEGYFGTAKRPSVQPGYRVFDVYCNGQTLLRNFDVATDPATRDRMVVKTFKHIYPTASGR